MEGKKLIFIAGVPGSGKSVLMRKLAARLAADGLKVATINDYDYFDQWKDDPKHKGLWKPVGDSFDLLPEAYEHVSSFTAAKVAQRVLELLEEYDVVLIEAARGVLKEGESSATRDNYNEHLVGPVLVAVDGRYQFKVAIIETTIDDVGELDRRVVDRFLKEDGRAAPPEVSHKYLDSAGRQVLSAVAELAGLFEAGILVLNRQFENGLPEDSELGRQKLADLYAELRVALGFPKSTVEGQPRNVEVI